MEGSDESTELWQDPPPPKDILKIKDNSIRHLFTYANIQCVISTTILCIECIIELEKAKTRSASFLLPRLSKFKTR